MAEQLYNKIPSLDLANFLSGNAYEKDSFVTKLGQAFHQIGSVLVSKHFLSADLQEKLYREVKNFFDLPDKIKLNQRLLEIGLRK